MKLNTYLRRVLTWGLSLLICTAMLTPPSLAASAVQPLTTLPDKCSLEVKYLCANMKVKLYKISDIKEGPVYVPDSSIQGYLEMFGYDLNQVKTASDWSKISSALALLISNYSTTRRGTTNEQGVIKFERLDPGLYMIANESGTRTELVDGEMKEVVYLPGQTLVCLPNWMMTTADPNYHWEKDVVANLSGKMNKYTSPRPDPGSPPSMPKSVTKVWLDSKGNPLKDHPDSIKVQLLKNGELYATVELSAKNGWTYTWPELDATARWTFNEVDNKGYIMNVESAGIYNTKITNTLPKPDNPPPDNPPPPPPPDKSEPDKSEPDKSEPDKSEPPDDPPPEEFDIPDDPTPLGPPPPLDDDTDTSYEEIEIDDPDVPLANLPQTGQLWWPVPLLAIGGIFLFLIGWAKRREAEDEE